MALQDEQDHAFSAKVWEKKKTIHLHLIIGQLLGKEVGLVERMLQLNDREVQFVKVVG